MLFLVYLYGQIGMSREENEKKPEKEKQYFE